MKNILLSKKFQTAIITLIVVIAGHFGFQLDEGVIGLMIAPLITFIAAHAFVDRAVTTAQIHQATELKIAAIHANPQSPQVPLEKVADAPPPSSGATSEPGGEK